MHTHHVPWRFNVSSFHQYFLFSRLPDNVSLEEGAILEPLSVGVHACKRANVTVGSVALILGAGPIGLVTLLSAKAFGASKVLITDIVDNRLKVAKELGADYTVLVNKNDTDDDVVKKVVDILGVEPSVSFDCSGAELSVRIAVKVRKNIFFYTDCTNRLGTTATTVYSHAFWANALDHIDMVKSFIAKYGNN